MIVWSFSLREKQMVRPQACLSMRLNSYSIWPRKNSKTQENIFVSCFDENLNATGSYSMKKRIRKRIPLSFQRSVNHDEFWTYQMFIASHNPKSFRKATTSRITGLLGIMEGHSAPILMAQLRPSQTGMGGFINRLCC